MLLRQLLAVGVINLPRVTERQETLMTETNDSDHPILVMLLHSNHFSVQEMIGLGEVNLSHLLLLDHQGRIFHETKIETEVLKDLSDLTKRDATISVEVLGVVTPLTTGLQGLLGITDQDHQARIMCLRDLAKVHSHKTQDRIKIQGLLEMFHPAELAIGVVGLDATPAFTFKRLGQRL